MNDERMSPDEHGALSDALRWQLRALRRDAPPPVDLWPGIEARLAAAPQPRRVAAPRFALAASVLLVIAAGGLVLGTRAPGGTASVAHREAQSMTREYDRALQAMPDAQAPAELAPAFTELDRSAREIRRALQRDPDSRLLLEQLRRTYSLRLALSQRALVG
ncbi:hypothetical protein [Cognatilysobacter segetis]|uniref:hypothetical protein n=1 Tax=Cognatilysobacter segetis TaxID=2492394 RepID=UPI00105BBFA3|nr:hypothetical protein [Lysobacter segetis]